MLQNLDLFNPDFVIYCKNINDPSSIYEIMRGKNITRSYVYGMCFQPSLLTYDFIKVGMSSPKLGIKREHQVGERIVRQLAWVPGWKSAHVKSGHGSEFWCNIQDCIAKKELPSNFNKNMITVAVWNVSERSYQNTILTDDDDLTSAKWAEGSLAFQYKEKNNGKLPMLNYADPSMCREFNKPCIRKDIFEKLFSYS